jgi:colanic acid/amylovoran biosynthesis glycosyltransferase
MTKGKRKHITTRRHAIAACDCLPGRRTVLQVRKRFFEGTETFLYNLIGGLTTWRPVLACLERVNETSFPMPGAVTVSTALAVKKPFSRVERLLLERYLVSAGAFRAIMKTRPTIVHAHFGYEATKVATVCRILRRSLITSFYGIDTAPPSSGVAQELTRGYDNLLKHSAALVVEGPHAAKMLIEGWGCAPASVRIVRIAIPVQEISFRLRNPADRRPVRLLQCGRMVEKKGLLQLIAALGELKKRFPSFELRIIGDGNLRPKAEEMVNALELTDAVQFLGNRTRPEFWKELDSCDLLVAPSLTASNGDTEGGAPTVILEAQAAGVPVVATDHADIPNVVLQGKSAWLARQGDVSSLVETLETAVEARAQWPLFGAEGRRFVLQHHDSKVVCADMERLYDEISGVTEPDRDVKTS